MIQHSENGIETESDPMIGTLPELYLIKKDSVKYTEYFARAYRELSKDIWLSKNESPRLERMRALGVRQRLVQ